HGACAARRVSQWFARARGPERAGLHNPRSGLVRRPEATCFGAPAFCGLVDERRLKTRSYARRVPSRSVSRRRLHGALMLIVCTTAACSRSKGPRDAPAAEFRRGDVVVVERAAAEFFEGRVLAVAPSSLKVQTSEDGEPVVVAVSDAYRVADAAHDVSPGGPA